MILNYWNNLMHLFFGGALITLEGKRNGKPFKMVRRFPYIVIDTLVQKIEAEVRAELEA